MKNLKSLFAVAAAIVSVAGAVHAAPQTAQSTLTYSPNAAMDWNASGNDPVVISGSAVNQTVNIQPYFYVEGQVGGTWNINGWGAAEDVRSGSLTIYHNKKFNLTGAGWGTWTQTPNDTTSADPTLSVAYDLLNSANVPLTTKPYANVSTLNGTVLTGITPAITGGKATANFNLKLNTTGGTTAGTYVMNPSFSFNLLP